MWSPSIETLVADIAKARPRNLRKIIGLSGPPASGKSTLAAALVNQLNEQGIGSCVVPMDGFHLDNAVLDARGLRDRKGAPETFDSDRFVKLVADLGMSQKVTVPTFDRANDCVIPNGDAVNKDHKIVMVEGNYLHLNIAPWSELPQIFDLSFHLTAPITVLRQRLIQRWLDHGLPHPDAVTRAEGNDLANAKFIAQHSVYDHRIQSI